MILSIIQAHVQYVKTKKKSYITQTRNTFKRFCIILHDVAYECIANANLSLDANNKSEICDLFDLLDLLDLLRKIFVFPFAVQNATQPALNNEN